MRILLLIVLICNVSALILALISMYITNRTFKEYERELTIMNLRVNYYKGLSKFKFVIGKDHE